MIDFSKFKKVGEEAMSSPTKSPVKENTVDFSSFKKIDNIHMYDADELAGLEQRQQERSRRKTFDDREAKAEQIFALEEKKRTLDSQWKAKPEEEKVGYNRDNFLKAFKAANSLEEEVAVYENLHEGAFNEVLEVATPTVDSRVSEDVRKHEGYFEGSKLGNDMHGNGSFNVPSSGNSGLTIAGIDVGTRSSGGAYDKIVSFMTPEQKTILEKAVGKSRGDDGSKQAEIEKIAQELDDSGFELTNAQISEVQAFEIDEVVKDLKEDMGEEAYNMLPEEVKVAFTSQVFNTKGPKSVKKLAKAIKSGEKDDWEAAYKEFNEYGWKSGTGKSVIDRTDNVASAIREYIEGQMKYATTWDIPTS